jgi:hypothetical protein
VVRVIVTSGVAEAYEALLPGPYEAFAQNLSFIPHVKLTSVSLLASFHRGGS